MQLFWLFCKKCVVPIRLLFYIFKDLYLAQYVQLWVSLVLIELNTLTSTISNEKRWIQINRNRSVVNFFYILYYIYTYIIIKTIKLMIEWKFHYRRKNEKPWHRFINSKIYIWVTSMTHPWHISETCNQCEVDKCLQVL